MGKLKRKWFKKDQKPFSSLSPSCLLSLLCFTQKYAKTIFLRCFPSDLHYHRNANFLFLFFRFPRNGSHLLVLYTYCSSHSFPVESRTGKLEFTTISASDVATTRQQPHQHHHQVVFADLLKDLSAL